MGGVCKGWSYEGESDADYHARMSREHEEELKAERAKTPRQRQQELEDTVEDYRQRLRRST